MANYYEQCDCGAYCQEAPCYDCLKRQLAEAVGALELFKFPGVIGSDLPDDYTFTVEIKAVNFKRVEQLLQSPAAKAGERWRAMEAVVEAAKRCIKAERDGVMTNDYYREYKAALEAYEEVAVK